MSVQCASQIYALCMRVVRVRAPCACVKYLGSMVDRRGGVMKRGLPGHPKLLESLHTPF